MPAKRRWGLIFLTSGVLAMTASLMAAAGVWAISYAVVMWPVTGYAGYRIWKGAQRASWREFAGRAAGVIIVVVGLALIVANPQLILVLLGAWIVGILAGAVVLYTTARSEAPSRGREIPGKRPPPPK